MHQNRLLTKIVLPDFKPRGILDQNLTRARIVGDLLLNVLEEAKGRHLLHTFSPPLVSIHGFFSMLVLMMMLMVLMVLMVLMASPQPVSTSIKVSSRAMMNPVEDLGLFPDFSKIISIFFSTKYLLRSLLNIKTIEFELEFYISKKDI